MPRVAIVPTSSPLREPGDLDRIVAVLGELSLEGVPGEHALARHGHLAGTAAQRVADIHAAFSDPSIHALLAMRGGYGAAELLPLLDPELIAAHPKPLVGMSDVTMLHLFLERCGSPSWWGPVGTQLVRGTDYTRAGFARALLGPTPAGALELPTGARVETLVRGAAEGQLGGGTTTLLAASLGTPWEVDTAGRVVILEDVGMETYELDRALVQLIQAGKLADAAALAIGTHVEVVARPPALSLMEVLERLLVPLGLPALYGLPLGHAPDLATVPYGAPVRLDASSGVLALLPNSSSAR